MKRPTLVVPVSCYLFFFTRKIKPRISRLGIEETGNFFLDLEDYLSGLTQLSNELSRFSVNAVTHGDYSRPQRIAAFLNDLLVRTYY